MLAVFPDNVAVLHDSCRSRPAAGGRERQFAIVGDNRLGAALKRRRFSTLPMARLEARPRERKAICLLLMVCACKHDRFQFNLQ